MKKYLLLTIVLLIIAAIGTAGFFFAFSPKKNNVVPPSLGTAKPALPSLASFRGVLAEAINNLDSEISKVSPPSGTSQTSPQTSEGAAAGPPDTSAFSFAIFGDTKEFSAGSPNGNLEKAVARVKDQKLAAVFVMGDLIKSCDGGSSCEGKFSQWKSVMAPILAKTYEIVGNHDRTGGDKADAVWQKEFNLPQDGPDGYKDLVYSFDIGNSHFAVLDSEKPKENIINAVQRDWLDRDLAATTKEHKFVLYHEPAFQAAQDAEDGLDAHPAERDALWNIIKKYHVDAVMNGHAHIYARKNVGGIEQIVIGDTDSTNDDFVQPGLSDFGYKGKSYAIATVNGKNINLKLFTVDGKQIDSFNFA